MQRDLGGVRDPGRDASKISESLEVRHARGDERYLSFSGEIEHPEPHEVIFADAAGRAHARRWTNRQSGQSAVRDATTAVLVVAEAMHGSASADIPNVTAVVADELHGIWSVSPGTRVLSRHSPRFEF